LVIAARIAEVFPVPEAPIAVFRIPVNATAQSAHRR
jgi:hypothetical protein